MTAFSRLAAVAGVMLLFAGVAAPASGAVSAIAFESGLEIWAMPASGGQPSALVEQPPCTDVPCPGAGAPVFSPDGSRLAFVVNSQQGGFPVADILVANADGSGVTPVHRPPGGLLLPSPLGFGPGGQIAFATVNVASDTYSEVVQVINSDGSGLRTVYTIPHFEYHVCCPTFTPDGRIVFAVSHQNNPDAAGVGLTMVNADGSGETQLTEEIYDGAPDVSPDGSLITFSRFMSGYGDIFVMNSNGSSPTNITNTPTSWEDDPTFSPEGNRIAVVSGFPQETYIETMAVNGSGRVDLTGSLPGEEESPAWANVPALPPPDGDGDPAAAFGNRTLVGLSLPARQISPGDRVKARIRNRNAFEVIGTLRARTVDRVSVSRKRRVALEAKAFRVAAESRKTVKLRLPKTLRTVLTREGELALRLVAKVEDPAGNRRKVKKRVVLLLED